MSGRPNAWASKKDLAKARIVAALSWLETPVVQPSNLSMVTVKGVPSIEVL